MAAGPVTEERTAPARLERWLTGLLLRPEPGAEDVYKWVEFGRRVLVLIFASVVLCSGLMAVLSTRQAQGLLEESLASEGRAIGEGLARAAYVPLELEDDWALERLVDGYRGVAGLAWVRVLDDTGRLRAEASRPRPDGGVLALKLPVVPPEEAGAEPVGSVEVAMAAGRMRAQARRIAWLNMGVSALLTLAISVAGFLLLGRLVGRLRELVGEARLVAQVKAANAELEAFSYSVAHDLRAPLRHVDGFIQLLQARVGKSLDEEGRRHVQVIAAAAKRMGAMIDDLLSFSRMARAEMRRRAVALGPLAARARAELSGELDGRAVEWRLGELPEVEGDEAMLQLVFSNLLSNAVKYTRGREPAVIEVDARREPGRHVVRVKDNGAGFDMRYAGKLFGVFQRLHRAEEFEGTGIGLANVRRIVQRHGGEVWAEGEPGKGAAFYFSLPAPGGKS